MKKLISIVNKLGATLESDIVDGVTDIEILAPDNKVWVESGSVSLVGRYYAKWPETKKECIQDLIERINQGIECE